MTDALHISMGQRLRCLLAVSVLLLLGLMMGATRDAHAAEDPNQHVYINLDPIDFSFMGANQRIDREVSVRIALELKPGVTQAMVQPFEPELQDKLLTVLNALWLARKPHTMITAAAIKETAWPAIISVAGKDKIAQVLILDITETLA